MEVINPHILKSLENAVWHHSRHLTERSKQQLEEAIADAKMAFDDDAVEHAIQGFYDDIRRHNSQVTHH